MTTPITVYRTVTTIKEKCAFGEDHRIGYVESVGLTDTGETRVYNNGYSREHTGLYADAEGRIYHAHPPLDFYGGTGYRRDDDGTYFYSRPNEPFARLLDGSPANDRTPAGPALRVETTTTATYVLDA